MRILGVKLPKIKFLIFLKKKRKQAELKKAKEDFYTRANDVGMAQALEIWKKDTDAINKKYCK